MKRKSILKFFAIIIGFVIIFSIFFVNSTKIILKTGKSYYKSKIMAISYDAIGKCLSNKEKLEDLILIEKDKNNNVSYISANTYKINNLAIEISQNYLKIINNAFDKGIPIPIGAFTGIGLISGFGKNINVKLVTITSVKCEFVSEFEEMGINQTRHLLKLNVYTTADIVCQQSSTKTDSQISIILFDNLIVGKVPNTYLDGKILGNAISKNN